VDGRENRRRRINSSDPFSSYERNLNGDPIPNGIGGYNEIYTGSLTRYALAPVYVDAYYAEFDLLSLVQDSTPIPNAIGNRYDRETPYDLQVAGASAIFAAGIVGALPFGSVLGGISAADTMRECHKTETVLYGLLVEEGALGNIVVDVLGYDAFFP
jgi:hypothetical protein